MTELIERLAREAGLPMTVTAYHPESLEAFAKAVARECAGCCDDFAKRCNEKFGLNGTPEHIAEQCAKAIRERFGIT